MPEELEKFNVKVIEIFCVKFFSQNFCWIMTRTLPFAFSERPPKENFLLNYLSNIWSEKEPLFNPSTFNLLDKKTESEYWTRKSQLKKKKDIDYYNFHTFFHILNFQTNYFQIYYNFIFGFIFRKKMREEKNTFFWMRK